APLLRAQGRRLPRPRAEGAARRAFVRLPPATHTRWANAQAWGPVAAASTAWAPASGAGGQPFPPSRSSTAPRKFVGGGAGRGRFVTFTVTVDRTLSYKT